MYKNGVSHMTASDDFEGVSKIVDWLSFVPDRKNQPVPIGLHVDPWDRTITYSPPQKQPYDVRWLIGGKDDEEGFLSGLYDKDSFQESLGGWAKTVVVGRARLGGIPMGVIAVETRSVENVTPADPANPDSTEMITQEAGGVWYPNSAFKTAQAIQDFNNGEQLPLMILANWRGFSGGQRDMYNEVLKYGSYIVDALVKYEQPIFVYIPPFGELRGGSWVSYSCGLYLYMLIQNRWLSILRSIKITWRCTPMRTPVAVYLSPKVLSISSTEKTSNCRPWLVSTQHMENFDAKLPTHQPRPSSKMSSRPR